MTDHEHECEFKISGDLPEYPGADCECGETITIGDVHQRLNEHPKLKRVRDAAIEYHWLEGRQVCLDKQYGVPCSLCTALVNTQDSS